jgi:hypothetical protein
MSRGGLRLLSEYTASGVPWRSTAAPTTLPSRNSASGADFRQELAATRRPSSHRSSPHNCNGRHSAPPLNKQTCAEHGGRIRRLLLSRKMRLVIRNVCALRRWSSVRSFDLRVISSPDRCPRLTMHSSARRSPDGIEHLLHATRALDSRVTQPNPANHAYACQLLPAQIWAQTSATRQPSLWPL